MTGEEVDQCSAPPRGQDLGGDRRGTRLHEGPHPKKQRDKAVDGGESLSPADGEARLSLHSGRI